MASLTTIPIRATTPTKAIKLNVNRVISRPDTTPIMDRGMEKSTIIGCLKELNWAVSTKKIRISPRNMTLVMERKDRSRSSSSPPYSRIYP